MRLKLKPAAKSRVSERERTAIFDVSVNCLVRCFPLLYNNTMRIARAHCICATRHLDMTQTYDDFAPKKAANLSINSSLLAKAKLLKLNLSATLESALVEKVRKMERTQWLEENQNAIAASNKLADENGLFADSYKTI